MGFCHTAVTSHHQHSEAPIDHSTFWNEGARLGAEPAGIWLLSDGPELRNLQSRNGRSVFLPLFLSWLCYQVATQAHF